VAVSLVFLPVIQFLDGNGNPLAGAKLFSYLAGTSTPAALYADPGGVTPLANPAIADSGGRLTAYATIGTGFKFNLLDANNVQQPGWPIDNYLVAPLTTPAQLAASFTDVAGMQASLDPGEVGTEILPTSHAAEHQQLKLVLKEMKGTAQWYESYKIRRVPVFATSQADENVTWLATGTTAWNFRFVIPDGWQDASQIAVKLLRRSSVGSGTAVMRWRWQRVRDNTAPTPAPGSPETNADFVLSDTNTHLYTNSIVPGGSFPTLQANDIVVVTFTRLGDDGGDTCTGQIIADGLYVEYTGLASR
jgi:hypothetical protein